MRDFLGFLFVLLVVFFVVGEWRGWYVGIPGQMPMMVYKKDFVAEAQRRTINIDALPVDLRGRVRNGRVKVEVLFDDIGSFQAGRTGTGQKRVFEEEFREGQMLVLNQPFSQGKGIYTLRLTFDDATGIFRLKLPTAAEL